MADRLTAALDRIEFRFTRQTGVTPADAVSDEGVLLLAAQAAARLADLWESCNTPGDKTRAAELRAVLETALCGKEAPVA
jgi:hypothetical protein